MDYVGIDLHRRKGQICIFRGGRVERMPDPALSLSSSTGCWVRGRRRGPCSRPSTESEWVARCLGALGKRSWWPTRTSRRFTPRGLGRSRPIGGMPRGAG
jgi:hypothetical protein